MYNFCAVPTPCDFVYIIPPNLFWCRYPLVCGYFVALLSGIFIDIGPRNKHFSKSSDVFYWACWVGLIRMSWIWACFGKLRMCLTFSAMSSGKSGPPGDPLIMASAFSGVSLNIRGMNSLSTMPGLTLATLMFLHSGMFLTWKDLMVYLHWRFSDCIVL